MKTFKIFSLLFTALTITTLSFAQVKTETFAVSGNCGMCKANIEKAAKAAGATKASWSEESKAITVEYNAKKTSTEKIQQQIADAGYDNVGAKASDASYKKLHACCQYDRATPPNPDAKPAKDEQCAKACADKDGKADCCKKEGTKPACCSKEGDSHH